MAMVRIVLALLIIVTAAAPASGELKPDDWPAWRGPTLNNVAAPGQNPPTSWSETENVKWKTPVPGRGHSSPIVVGQRVILTTADEAKHVQSVLAFDRATGKPLWKTDVNTGGLPAKIHKKNTHATPTSACDGERLFAVFHNHGRVQLTALDLSGKVLWQKVAGAYQPQQYQFGYAPSPLLYKGLVIISAEFEKGYLAAFDKTTGEEVWRTPRLDNTSYSSPIVARVAGRDQLLITGADLMASFDPSTGRPLWSTKCIAPATCGTVVWTDQLVFGSGGYPRRETVAVHADGSGRIAWRNAQKCYEQSMLVHDGYLYAMTDTGATYCWKADTGDEMWTRRFRGPVSTSPVLAGGHIYTANERGVYYVFKADSKAFELVSEFQFGDEGFATPTIVGGQLFIRAASKQGGKRQEMLYCIGK